MPVVVLVLVAVLVGLVLLFLATLDAWRRFRRMTFAGRRLTERAGALSAEVCELAARVEAADAAAEGIASATTPRARRSRRG